LEYISTHKTEYYNGCFVGTIFRWIKVFRRSGHSLS